MRTPGEEEITAPDILSFFMSLIFGMFQALNSFWLSSSFF